jgi:hypothetical protein
LGSLLILGIAFGKYMNSDAINTIWPTVLITACLIAFSNSLLRAINQRLGALEARTKGLEARVNQLCNHAGIETLGQLLATKLGKSSTIASLPPGKLSELLDGGDVLGLLPNRKIEALRLVMEKTGLSLKESKDLIDALIAELKVIQ